MLPDKKPTSYKNYLDGSDLGIAPKSDQIEVSIIGTGYGESVLVHVGNDNWIIIDSCQDPTSRQTLPFLYLSQIGVKPENAIKQIVASHWHDDHIRGLSEIVSQCASAEFVCSNALKVKDFLTIVYAYGTRSMMESSGIDEFYRIIQILAERSERSEKDIFNWAMADKLLYRTAQSENTNQISCEIHALTPSNDAITKSLLEISSLIPNENEPKKRVNRGLRNENYCAIVLWIKAGNHCILLGSDLEESGNKASGWTAIIKSVKRPRGKASLYKIAHHGSRNGNLQSIWSELLYDNPMAILTPFVHGNVSLPKTEDIQQIIRNTNNAYITAIPRIKKSTTPRQNTVNRSIKEVAGSLRYLHSSLGQVRMRLSISDAAKCDNWQVERFGEAVKLTN
jgi:beta-lactamase superfamily II metal-dependent hydrolase